MRTVFAPMHGACAIAPALKKDVNSSQIGAFVFTSFSGDGSYTVLHGRAKWERETASSMR
jgi:hypothetical protein